MNSETTQPTQPTQPTPPTQPDTQTPPAAEQAQQLSANGTLILGGGLLLAALMITLALYCLWPPLMPPALKSLSPENSAAAAQDPNQPTASQTPGITPNLAAIPSSDPEKGEGRCGCSPFDPETKLLLLVMAFGALGSFLHAGNSFVEYAGRRKLVSSWMWWYALRLPMGSLLAVLCYIVLRGGLVNANLGDASAKTSGQGLNVFGVLAIASLSGMFAKRATDKLADVFDVFFAGSRSQNRPDGLVSGLPAILEVTPNQLQERQPKTLTVVGHTFHKDAYAEIDGKQRVTRVVGDRKLEVDLLEEDTVREKLTLQVINPGEGGGASAKHSLKVALRPVISGVAPPSLTTSYVIGNPATVNGANFHTSAYAEVNGEKRQTSFKDKTQLTFNLMATDVAQAKTLKLKVVNPPDDGGASDLVDWEVQG